MKKHAKDCSTVMKKTGITPRRFNDRAEWRRWLQDNFDRASEVWFVFPLKSANERGIPYNDAVEEALCFGWIDSTVRALGENHKMQRFSPRKHGSGYSQANKERLRRLADKGMIQPCVTERVLPILNEEFVYPKDIIDAVKANASAWENFRQFSDSYKRIRIAYIDAARKRPDEFQRRLKSFIDKTQKGVLIRGYGGIEEYY